MDSALLWLCITPLGMPVVPEVQKVLHFKLL
jgi:hypothetical protein